MLCKPDVELSNMALRKANAQLREAAVSPYRLHGYAPGATPPRFVTWREFGEERNNMCDTLTERIGVADVLVQNARAQARVEIDRQGRHEGYERALRIVNNYLVETGRVLRDEESELEESAAEESAAEESEN